MARNAECPECRRVAALRHEYSTERRGSLCVFLRWRLDTTREIPLSSISSCPNGRRRRDGSSPTTSSSTTSTVRARWRPGVSVGAVWDVVAEYAICVARVVSVVSVLAWGIGGSQFLPDVRVLSCDVRWMMEPWPLLFIFLVIRLSSCGQSTLFAA